MTRQRAIFAVIGVAVIALIAWIANNTEWVEEPIPAPLKGEARDNPFYAAQRLAEALGAETAASHMFDATRDDGVVVISSWHWDLSSSRRQALEAWVEAGGRLVLDRSVTPGGDRLKNWSGIGRRDVDGKTVQALVEADGFSRCRTFHEPRQRESGSKPEEFELCDFNSFASFTHGTTRPTWSLEDRTGIYAIRMPVGRGSVTMINGTPFLERALLEADHGRLFVAATQLRRGDQMSFLSEEDHPSILTLLWRRAAPAVSLALFVIALALWRGWVRFGPLAAVPERARRSLVEQIRGTGQFALRQGDGEALHTAMVRALREAARRRIPGYTRLSEDERFAAITNLTGMHESELAAAQAAGGRRGSRGVRHALAVLEAARRRTIIEGQRSRHARD